MKNRTTITLPYGGTPPYKKHGGDAGWDLAALENTTIPPQSSTMIELATRMNIPKGYVGLLTLRSSIAAPTPHNLAHHEIDFNDNDDTVNGIVYICIGSEDNWIWLDFKAHINKVHKAGYRDWETGYLNGRK